MKKLLICLLSVLSFATQANAQHKKDYTLLISGASFAAPQNQWFEMGCELLNATAVNKAVNGTSIVDLANKLTAGSLYTEKELDAIDALVIMHVHNHDVIEESALKDSYEEYTEHSNYAAAYDYVIKRYMADCYKLRFNKNSKYYNTTAGKPAIIVLSTHWHDARTQFNISVRMLAQKWGLPLVEFDDKIGFSYSELHPMTGAQTSLLYSDDVEVLAGVRHGLHPQEGRDKFIQKRMAAIFVDKMKSVLPIK